MTLAAERLTVTRGDRVVLHALDLALRPGELTIVVGPNGAGKSTLIRALAGLLKVTGQVTLGGVTLAALPAQARARALGVFLEAPDATFGFTARELVAMGRYPHLGRAFESDDDRRHTDRALAALAVADLAERPYARLSSGERQRVGLARLLCQAPDVLLFDEPTSRLDPFHALKVAGLMRDLARAGKTVLAAEHDLDLAAHFADRVVIIAAGRIVADGPPALVMTAAMIAEVYGVRARRVDAIDGERVALVIDAID